MRTDRLVLAGALAIVLTAGASVAAQFDFGGNWSGKEVLNEANKDSLGNILPDTVAFKPVAYYVKAGCNLIPDRLGLVLTYDQYSPGARPMPARAIRPSAHRCSTG